MRPHGLNIVAIGGGTGLSTLLRGLKTYVDAIGTWSIADLGAKVSADHDEDHGLAVGCVGVAANFVAGFSHCRIISPRSARRATESSPCLF